MFPLCTSILFGDEGRYSNAPVERWFGIVKHSLLKGETNMECSRVLRKIRSYVVAFHKETKLSLKRKRCAMSQKGVSKKGQGLLSIETWGKKVEETI